METQQRICCSVGIMAHNEEANIGRLLDAIAHQEQRVSMIREIIVVASGCTDNTTAIVEKQREKDPRIALLTQPRREGKTSAINQFITRASSEVLVMESADTVPLPTTIDRLVMPFESASVGMTGGHPIPVNNANTFIGFAGHLIWQLHHQVSLLIPKCGEIVAWRNSLQSVPATPVDEAVIEASIVAQGLKLVYVPDAVVYNCAPLNIPDFVNQRRRIWAGHLHMRRSYGYTVSTLSAGRVLRCLLATVAKDRRIKPTAWMLGVLMLEQYARLLGTLDVMVWRRDHTIWDVIESTKLVQHGLQ